MAQDFVVASSAAYHVSGQAGLILAYLVYIV